MGEDGLCGGTTGEVEVTTPGRSQEIICTIMEGVVHGRGGVSVEDLDLE